MINLLRDFSVAALIAITLVALVLGAVYRSIAERQLRHATMASNFQLTRSFTNNLWPAYAPFLKQASQMAGDKIRIHPETARLQQAVRQQVKGLPVVKIKIYDVNRMTLFSTEDKQIGELKSPDYLGSKVIASGQPASSISHRKTFTGIDAVLRDRYVLASYLPIRTSPDAPIEAVIEIYTDITELRANIQREHWLIILLSTGLLLLLYLALYFFVRRADRLIKQQHGELLLAHEEEAVLNTILEVVNLPLPLQQQLESILEELFSISWLSIQSQGCIFFVGNDPSELVMAAQRGLTCETKETCNRTMFGDCLCGQAAQTRQVVYADHVDERHTVRFDGMKPHGHVCLPILFDDHLLGVLNLYLDEGCQLQDQEKKFLCSVVSTLAWIIERRLTDEKIRESADRYRGLLEAAPDAVIVTDKGGRIVLANQNVSSVFGYTSKELVGQSVEILVPEALRMHHNDLRKGYGHQPRTRPMANQLDLTGRRKDGTVIPVEISLSPLKTKTGLLVTSIIRDISDRKETEQQLNWLASFPEISPNPVIEVNRQGKVTYVNPIGRELFPDLMKAGLAHPMISAIQPLLKSRDEGDDAPLLLDTVINNKTYQLNISRVPGENNYRIHVWDITIMHHMAQELTHQASHDALTGLVNRHEFEIRLDRALISARSEDKQHAVLYLDLDQFKMVNDTCGHIAGDELLKQLTLVLQGHIHNSDTLARLGGDEFGLLLQYCSLENAIVVAEKVRKVVGDFQFCWEQQIYKVGVSIGVAAINAESANLTEILSAADSACYVAKEAGRNRVHAYQPDDTKTAQLQGEMRWIPRIRKALEENRFRLYCQKIMPLKVGASNTTHYEILLRMLDEQGEIIPPKAFIPAAERYNLMSAIDRWVISETLKILQTEARHIDFCAINLSGQSICEDLFLDFVVDQIKLYGIDPGRLCFEVTETAAIANLTEATQFFTTLQEMGCMFALDDFGSGLSSFVYLRSLPANFLKIDGSFVKDILSDTTNRTVVQIINQLGHVMGMKTIAEFVEDTATLYMLREMGIDYAQGYLIDMPQPLTGNAGMAAGKQAKGQPLSPLVVGCVPRV
jgi:diguanylate cyclase (GGDEF)-like protein/PAS domain S-box-containing protein